MTDTLPIVERLKMINDQRIISSSAFSLRTVSEAADLIEKLTEALEPFAQLTGLIAVCHIEAARAALELAKKA